MRGTFTHLQQRVIQFVSVVMIGIFTALAMIGLHRMAQIHGDLEWPEMDIIRQQRIEIRGLEAKIDTLQGILDGPFTVAPFEPMPGDVLPDRPGPVDKPLVEPKPFH